MRKEKWRYIKKQFALLKNPFALVFYIIIWLYVISLIVPTIWMFFVTLKDSLQFRYNRFGLPNPLTFENYLNVFSKMYIQIIYPPYNKIYVPQLMFNGVTYAVLNAAAPLFTQCLVSYGCTKYKSAFGSFLQAFAIITMILPLVGSMGATLRLYRMLGLYNNFPGIIFAHAGWGGSNFLIFCGMFKGVANDYRDAAFIDGAGHFRVFTTIMLPMVKTSIMALFILSFIAGWNDYMTPMVYLPKYPTIAYGLFSFRNSTDSLVSQIPMQMTGCLVVMIPIIILFVCFRNKIMGNITLGGLKG